MANTADRMGGAPLKTGPGRLFLTRWLPVLAYVALVFTLSAQPNLSVPGTFRYRDKVAHLLEYGGLAWLVQRAARDTWPGAGPARRALVALLAVTVIGACDERSQRGVPGRDSSVYDWLADTTGASLATALSAVLSRGERDARA
ncbi:MAG TPA: VanZ family protein [Candidatus Eisenbacteria bacterium]